MDIALQPVFASPATARPDLRVMEPAPSFQQIVDAHYPGLHRFALSMCRREDVAEDLVQQTFLQWARKGHSLRDRSKVKTWLFTTLYREWLGQARREARHPEIEFEPDLHGVNGPEEEAPEPQVDSATLHEALERLDPGHRAPLVLFYLKELSYRDIVDTLGVPIGTVMSRLSRAKDRLRSILRSLQEEGAPSNILTMTRP